MSTGVSARKSAIGKVLGVAPDESLEGTLATTVLAVVQGVEFVRVHDVLANARAVKMTEAQLRALVASALRAQLTDWTEEQED